MMDATIEGPENQVAIVRHQLDSMQEQFKAALPAHIPVERFARVLMTAIQNNPEIMQVERRSLLNAAMRAAQDGLLPDGREGAIVLFKDKNRGKIAQWMPMIGGLRKKVRNSGEIATWDVYVVHENDEFEYRLGDDPFIHHKPTLGEPGKVIAAYSVAVLKTGEKSREVMSVSAIEKVRSVSLTKDSPYGPWVKWYEEMCRKTVARRHAKVLPMSTDLDDLLRRDDMARAAHEHEPTLRPRSLTQKLDAIAHRPEPEPDPLPDELAGQLEAFAGDLRPDPDPPEPDPLEPVRQRAKADAAKKIRRMAPTSLTDAEKDVYLQAFDSAKAETG